MTCSRGHAFRKSREYPVCPKCWPGYYRKRAQREVDAYIKAAPKHARAKLTQLRRIIKAAAPKAEERISYGMPYYGYKGRLAYFGFAKAHVGLYIPSPVIAEHGKELAGYGTSMATVRFPLDRKLPAALIRKLIKARIRKNDAIRAT